MKKYHLAVCRPGFAGALCSEFKARWGISGEVVHKAAVAFPESAKLPPISETVFVRQYLPLAMRVTTADDSDVIEAIAARLKVLARRDNKKSPGKVAEWHLHSFAIDDDPAIARAAQIGKSVRAQLQKIFPSGFGSLLQIFVAGPEDVWFSVATLPGTGATLVSPHIGGVQRMRAITGAPSRSSSKLSEALEYLSHHGIKPAPGETAVDLGAAPGGWTLVMALRGVDVTAVDHAELDLPAAKKLQGIVTHVKANGLKYLPDEPVDWLCCDMVMGSRQTLEVLQKWLEGKNGLATMRRFVVNVKLPQAAENTWPAVAEALALLNEHATGWRILRVRQLFHDRNEVTLIGVRD
jgi:23S rRNA C2498 (ribose-2'-O)-methylase RlmM